MIRAPRRATATLLAGLLAGSLAGCGSAAPGTPPSPSPAAAESQPPEALRLTGGTTVLVGAGAGGSSTAAQVRGRVLTPSSGCLLLDDGVSAALHLLVLEHGTRATEDGAGIVTPDGVEVRDGDGITAAGRVEDADDAQLQQDWPTAPEECRGPDRVARVTDDLRVDPSVVAEQVAAFGHREQFDDGSVLLVPAEPPTAGADALTGGVVTRLEGGCLGLLAPDGRRTLVKWPFGTSWDPQQQVLELPQQGPVPLGQEVSLGGGQGVADWVRPGLPQECGYDDVWVVS